MARRLRKLGILLGVLLVLVLVASSLGCAQSKPNKSCGSTMLYKDVDEMPHLNVCRGSGEIEWEQYRVDFREKGS